MRTAQILLVALLAIPACTEEPAAKPSQPGRSQPEESQPEKSQPEGAQPEGAQPESSQQAAAPAFSDIDVPTAVKLLEDTQGMVILDIRTPGEFDRGHLKGARLIDYKAADFKEQLSKLDRETPYLMHCASGGRSAAAQPIFEELGFKRIYHLKPGYRGWAAAQQPVEK